MLANVHRQLDVLVVIGLDRDRRPRRGESMIMPAASGRPSESAAARSRVRIWSLRVVRGESHFLLHVVPVLVEAPVRLTDVHAEISHRGDEEQR